MAGGKNAIIRAKEGSEDNYEEGARAITRLDPTKKDVVVGVSASGMTPFVRGALTSARKAGSRVVFVTCDPRNELQAFVDLTIAPAVGPEIIAGSTRLKAGTATKLVLNMLTTSAMILIGKTYGNLMVDVNALGSEKLRDRARRIVHIVTDLDYEDADKLLKSAQMEREDRDRDAEDGPHVHQGDRPPEEVGRLDPRGDRRRHRAAPARADRRLSRQATAGFPINHHRHVVMHLQQRRRQPRRNQSVDHAVHGVGLLRAGGNQHDLASRPRIVDMPIDSARSGTAVQSPPNRCALACRLSSSRSATWVVAHRPSAGSLKPMWPFAPMPRICRSMPPAAAIAAS